MKTRLLCSLFAPVKKALSTFLRMSGWRRELTCNREHFFFFGQKSSLRFRRLARIFVVGRTKVPAAVAFLAVPCHSVPLALSRKEKRNTNSNDNDERETVSAQLKTP